MKILELRFKNLNSLYGEWKIDFTDPEYVSNGIFTLTGPTGAGKSTILDAICLALYGETPRLGKITKRENEIMSRQTWECFAEVKFESQAGRFLCHWEQRRAHKQAEGKLQDQEHQIADADTGKPIETMKSLVVSIIEEKTGMDFKRFTRSILLAQGDFDTFLKANDEEKSKILEQITGTEIYTEISKRVHIRQREERDKLNLLYAETSIIEILDPEEEKEIQQDLQINQKQETELNAKVKETEKAIKWLTDLEELEEEIQELLEDEEDLKNQVEDFKPERDMLEQANKAASLDGKYATLTSLRKQQSENQAALKKQEDELPELKNSEKSQAGFLKNAEQFTQKAKDDMKAEIPLIKRIRSIDQKIEDQSKSVSDLSESCTKDKEEIKKDKQARMKEQNERTKSEKTLNKVKKYLDLHAEDKWLISGFAGIEEQLVNLVSKQNEVFQKETDIENADTAMLEASKELDDSKKQCTIHKQELKKASKNLQQSKDDLNKLLGDKKLREYRDEKESMLREMALIRRIEELEDYRKKLEDGKPCPLCGSTKHPYAEGNVPEPDEIEQKIDVLDDLIEEAENLEADIKKLEKTQTKAQDNLNASEKLETKTANDKKTAEKELAGLKEDLKKLQNGYEKLKLSVTKKLQPLGITEIPESEVISLLESLKTRLDDWQEQDSEKIELEKQIYDIESEIKRLDAVIETQEKTLDENQKKLEQLKTKHAADEIERKKLFGDKNPDDEEDRLNKAITGAEKAERNARKLYDDIKKKLTTAQSNVESLKERIKQNKPELKNAETDFSAELGRKGFADETEFLEARLTDAERKSLSSQAKELDDAQTELKAKQKDRKKRLTTEKAKKVTNKTLVELEPQLEKDEESLNELRDVIADCKYKLKENKEAKKRYKEKQSAIEAQEKECNRWEKLHSYIGSADGKKYRNFAQGLTFELMVSHANKQLEKMYDRYQLIRNKEHPLELNIIDYYQAGEIRSTKNLSGGESFLVSLTLALGLSKMASQKVRVDSLFLDEGFGTLDEDALETALDTLSGLQQDGKLIGVISHVSAMKERISTQIEVSPVSNGRSSISGPGCKKVN